MVSVNLIFHLSSALILGFLIWYLLGLQTRLRIHAQLWICLQKETRQIRVERPDIFFANLTTALSIELHWDAPRLPPQKIQVDPWVHAHAALGIQAISCAEANRLAIRVNRANDLGTWKQKLEASLQNTIQIVWQEPSGPARDRT